MPFDPSPPEIPQTYRRLLAVAEVVRGLKDEQFCLDVWFESPMTGCGSIGCVIGWSAHKGVLDDVVVGPFDVPRIIGADGDIHYQDAWAEYFGLTEDEAYDVFFCTSKHLDQGESPATRLKTLAKLEALIKKYAPQTVVA